MWQEKYAVPGGPTTVKGALDKSFEGQDNADLESTSALHMLEDGTNSSRVVSEQTELAIVESL